MNLWTKIEQQFVRLEPKQKLQSGVTPLRFELSLTKIKL